MATMWGDDPWPVGHAPVSEMDAPDALWFDEKGEDEIQPGDEFTEFTTRGSMAVAVYAIGTALLTLVGTVAWMLWTI